MDGTWASFMASLYRVSASWCSGFLLSSSYHATIDRFAGDLLLAGISVSAEASKSKNSSGWRSLFFVVRSFRFKVSGRLAGAETSLIPTILFLTMDSCPGSLWPFLFAIILVDCRTVNSCKGVFFAVTFRSNRAHSTWVWYCSVGCGRVEPGEEEDEEEAGLRGRA